jgi:hypothetical protein
LAASESRNRSGTANTLNRDYSALRDKERAGRLKPLEAARYVTVPKRASGFFGGAFWNREDEMGRSRDRVCLQDGLRLDFNWLHRQGYVPRYGRSGPRYIQWTYTYTGECIARGHITAEIHNKYEGWFRIQLGRSFDQCMDLRSQPRHFGGQQWYFRCPSTGRYVSVLWKPNGSNQFCARQTWPRQVAYASQFECSDNRAWRGKAKIKARLIADRDPDDWDLPPKPKWMRWSTYNRLEEKFDRYESILDSGCLQLVAKFLGR